MEFTHGFVAGPWLSQPGSEGTGPAKKGGCLMRSKRSQELPTLLDAEGCGEMSPINLQCSGDGTVGADQRATNPGSSPPVESQEACLLTDNDDITQQDGGEDTGDVRASTSMDGYLSDAPSCGSIAPRQARSKAPGSASLQQQQQQQQLEDPAQPEDSDDEAISGVTGDGGPAAERSTKRAQGAALPVLAVRSGAAAAATLPSNISAGTGAKPSALGRKRQRSSSGGCSNEPDGESPRRRAPQPSGAAAAAPMQLPAPEAANAAAVDMARSKTGLAAMRTHYTQVQQTYLGQMRDIMATLAHRQRAALLTPHAAPAADMAAVSRACAAAMGIIQTVGAAAPQPLPPAAAMLGGFALPPSAMLQAVLAAAPPAHAMTARAPSAQPQA